MHVYSGIAAHVFAQALIDRDSPISGAPSSLGTVAPIADMHGSTPAQGANKATGQSHILLCSIMYYHVV